MIEKCQSVWGHNFEARYDSYIPEWVVGSGIKCESAEQLRTKSYAYDICTRCGQVVKKQ